MFILIEIGNSKNNAPSHIGYPLLGTRLINIRDHADVACENRLLQCGFQTEAFLISSENDEEYSQQLAMDLSEASEWVDVSHTVENVHRGILFPSVSEINVTASGEAHVVCWNENDGTGYTGCFLHSMAEYCFKQGAKAMVKTLGENISYLLNGRWKELDTD